MIKLAWGSFLRLCIRLIISAMKMFSINLANQKLLYFIAFHKLALLSYSRCQTFHISNQIQIGYILSTKSKQILIILNLKGKCHTTHQRHHCCIATSCIPGHRVASCISVSIYYKSYPLNVSE